MYKRGMSDSIERLSFELSTRALAEQERMLAGMRATAGTLIAAASVAASLRTPSTSPISFGGIVALAACALSVACAVWVLLPHTLTFAVAVGDLHLGDDRGDSHSLARAHLAASLWTEHEVHANRPVLARIALSLSFGSVLLLVEIALLIVATAW
jgi:hypothetical protein